MWNGVGGGTIVYAAQWQRNMPSDFRVRSLDGVADDWPLTYEDLEPYYVRVEKDFGISGLAERHRVPARRGAAAAGGAARAGGPQGRGARTTSSAGTGGRRRTRSRRAGTANLNPCVQRGDVPEGVRATAPRARVDITHWPVAQRARASSW